MDIEKTENDSWKEQATREKERLDAELKVEKERQTQLPPQPTFTQFVSGLTAQALMALGEAENPITKNQEIDLPQAKYLIDVIALIKDKTQGNLSEQEQEALNQILTDLRLRFVKASDKSKS
jgi:hypothetical protein